MARYSNMSPNRKAGKEFFGKADKMLKTSKRRKKSGCYVATCIYGSYDCPEVWTLRRFRDNTLDTSCCGRVFIRVYYAISPIIVRIFGNQTWFRIFWKNSLDRMVSKLNKHGVDSTPYSDKY